MAKDPVSKDPVSKDPVSKGRASKRCYRQFCGLARALDVVGERWTLLIVRDLLLGPWRYSDLLHRLPGMTTNLLARRLKEMEAHGLVEKRRLPPPASSSVYGLTELGRCLEPVCMALGQFGGYLMRSGPEADDRVDPGWALISMKRRYDGRGEVCLTFRIRGVEGMSEPVSFQLRAQPSYVDVRHGEPFPCDTAVEVSTAGLRALLFAGRPAAELEQKGLLAVRGEVRPWRAFLSAFGLTADVSDPGEEL